MRKSEIVKLIGICSVNYRNFPEQGKEEMLVELWVNMLDDIEFEVAEIAIKRHLSKSVFPPTIADIRQHIADLKYSKHPTPLEAWGKVTEVIRKYGSYRESDAMRELEGLTRKAVEYFGYRDLCISENVMADRAHFLKTYENLITRENENNKLSPLLQESLLKIGTTEKFGGYLNG